MNDVVTICLVGHSVSKNSFLVWWYLIHYAGLLKYFVFSILWQNTVQLILNLCFAWIYSFCLFTSSSFCYRTFVQTNYKIRTTAEFVNFFWPIARDLTVPNSSYDNFLMLFHSVSHCCFVSLCKKWKQHTLIWQWDIVIRF